MALLPTMVDEPENVMVSYGHDSSGNISKIVIPSHKRNCWLIYDLGLRGNYEGLYVWLDKMGAKECGNDAAIFATNKTHIEIKQELSKILNEGARAYLIDSNDSKGRFIIGGRKTPPWIGYGTEQVVVEEE